MPGFFFQIKKDQEPSKGFVVDLRPKYMGYVWPLLESVDARIFFKLKGTRSLRRVL